MNYVYLLVPGCNGYGNNYKGLEKLKFSIDSLKKNTTKFNNIYLYYGYDETSIDRISPIEDFCLANNICGINIGHLKHDFGICHARGISNPFRLNILVEKIYILINHDINEEICFIDIDTEFNKNIDTYEFDLTNPILWNNEGEILRARHLKDFFETMNYYVDPSTRMYNTGVIYVPSNMRKQIGQEAINLVFEMNKLPDSMRVARDLDEQISLSVIIHKYFKTINYFTNQLDHYWCKVHNGEEYWKPNFEDITIGYLSWKKYDIFEKTLQSHNSLFNLLKQENRIIFFQEIGEREINIANKFDCKYIGNKENIGILKAFIELVENCKTKYFIYCENDFLLLDNNEFDIKKTLEDTIDLLDNNPNAHIKLSNIKNPGFLYCTPKDKDEWLAGNQSNYCYKVESFSWIDEPEKYYSNLQVINKNYKWYLVNNHDQKWSNHIYAINTTFLKDVVLPILKFNIENNLDIDIMYQGLEEILINTYKYKGQDNKIDKLITELDKRVIIAGGGNFYHNKI